MNSDHFSTGQALAIAGVVMLVVGVVIAFLYVARRPKAVPAPIEGPADVRDDGIHAGPPGQFAPTKDELWQKRWASAGTAERTRMLLDRAEAAKQAKTLDLDKDWQP